MGEFVRLLAVMLLPLAGPGALEVPGIERVLRVDDRLLVGSQPAPRALGELAQLGVSVVVSVDGMPPQARRLEEAGLRSVHLPIGYDSVPPERIRSLARLALEEEGVIYVHCHHGRHRGPAAGAILWMLREGASPQRARTLLQAAGTSPDYAGLWHAVESFSPPSGTFPDAPLPARVEVGGLRSVMVEIDRAHTNLGRHARLQPDIGPEHEASILVQHLREMQRLDPDGRIAREAEYRTHATEALRAAEALAARKDSGTAQWNAALDRLDTTCTACHRAHRD